MLSRALRNALVTSLVLALWAFARPASAAPAPLCDDRGASAIAPPPALEAPDEAIARARLSTTCPGDDLPVGRTVAPAHRGVAPPAASVDLGLPATQSVPPSSGGDPIPATATEARPRAGVRARVERPPRA